MVKRATSGPKLLHMYQSPIIFLSFPLLHVYMRQPAVGYDAFLLLCCISSLLHTIGWPAREAVVGWQAEHGRRTATTSDATGSPPKQKTRVGYSGANAR